MPVFAPIQGPPTKGVQRCGSYAHGLRMAKLTHEYHRESVQGVSFSISSPMATQRTKKLLTYKPSNLACTATIISITIIHSHQQQFVWFYMVLQSNDHFKKWLKMASPVLASPHQKSVLHDVTSGLPSSHSRHQLTLLPLTALQLRRQRSP